MAFRTGLSVLLAASAIGAGQAGAQGCASMPPASDFEFQTLSTDVQGNAYDLAVAKDLKVYWVERNGNFKVYDPNSRATRLIHKFEVLYASSRIEGNVETGMQGIALDGDFESNGWVYLWYSVPESRLPGPISRNQPGPIERLSRFTLRGGTSLDPATEKIIFQHTVFAQCCHYGGDLDWGPDGNLWLSTGDNMNYVQSINNPFLEAQEYRDVRRTAGNTNDTRGKILRLRPIPFPDAQSPPPGPGSTYTIPPGNMRDTFAGQGFWSAAETAKVRPEIYSMGHRNPFTLAVHPQKHWPANGEAGWDNSSGGEDEINFSPRPQNNGWPFFNGGNSAGTQANLDPKVTAAAPMNHSKWNTGVVRLPPAVPAAISNRTAAMRQSLTCFGTALDWARHDSTLASSAKWPPYLHGKLLFSSYGSVPLQAATVDDGGQVTRVETVFPARSELAFTHRAAFGPDGALYVAKGEYTFSATTQSRIIRVSYRGPCARTVPVLRLARPRVHLGHSRVRLPRGVAGLQAFDMGGRMRWEYYRDRADAEADVELPPGLEKGLLHLRLVPDKP